MANHNLAPREVYRQICGASFDEHAICRHNLSHLFDARGPLLASQSAGAAIEGKTTAPRKSLLVGDAIPARHPPEVTLHLVGAILRHDGLESFYALGIAFVAARFE